MFFPALHGLTHFCERAMARELDATAERSELIDELWRAQTPYIHWRMPWIGYEYWDPELAPAQRFLPLHEQRIGLDARRTSFQLCSVHGHSAPALPAIVQMQIREQLGSKLECGSCKIVQGNAELHFWTIMECFLSFARSKWNLRQRRAR